MQTPLQLPREFERDSKVCGAPGYRHHLFWSRGGRGHPDSAKKVWAAFTGGKGNECNLWAGLFGPIQCPLVVISPSYRTVGIDVLYGCTTSSCKCHRGVSPTGRAARRKVLVPSGPTVLLTMLGYKSLRLVISLTGTSDKGRCPCEFWTLSPCHGIRHTPCIKQLLACYWAPVESEWLSHGGLRSLQRDIPTLRWVNSYSRTNTVERQLKMHI